MGRAGLKSLRDDAAASVVHNTIGRLRYLIYILAKIKDPAAVKLGRKGGKVIAKRGSEYFRQLQARRKKRKGGRPPKSKKSRLEFH